jgi:hypothetical protein
MRAALALATAGVFALGAAAGLLTDDVLQPRSRAAAAQVEQDTNAMQIGELDALRRELSRLREEVELLRQRAPSAGTRAAVQNVARTLEEAPPAAERERSTAIKARLDRELESFDADWSRDYEWQLSTLLQNPDLRAATVTDVQCGANICRVTAAHADLAAAEAFDNMLTLLAPASGGAWSQPAVSEDGSAESVVYLARTGTGVAFHASLADAQAP